MTQLTLYDDIAPQAILSKDRKERYLLRRHIPNESKKVTFIMLNPSTADEKEDDPTIRRCMGFAKAWGCGILTVVNICPIRATDPKEITQAGDMIENWKWIKYALDQADLIVAAWGTNIERLIKMYPGDFAAIGFMLSFDYWLECLGKTKAGHPRHPLYIKIGTELVAWP